MRDLKVGAMVCVKDINNVLWYAVITDRDEEKTAFRHEVHYTFQWDDGETEHVKAEWLNSHYEVVEVYR
jgi:hypothetical protein